MFPHLVKSLGLKVISLSTNSSELNTLLKSIK